MLGQSVVAVKGMHNHPPRALCLPARKPAARKQNDAVPPAPVPAHPTNKLEALSLTLELP